MLACLPGCLPGSYYPGLRFAFRCHPWTYGSYSWGMLALLLAAVYAANFEARSLATLVHVSANLLSSRVTAYY